MLKRVSVACIGLMLLGTRAHAADQPSQNLSAPSSGSAAHLQIDAIVTGQPAPYSGVLLDNPTFMLYLRDKVALEEANLRIVARDKMLQDIASKAERSWWERNGFWVGAAVGFIGSVFVVWEVRQVLVSK